MMAVISQFRIPYLTDILDVVIIAFLIYWLITLLRNSRYQFVFAGLATMIVVYFIAIFLDLRLTSSLFNSFFSILILGVVIVFQDELRRFFELVAFWASGWKKQKKPVGNFIDDLVETVDEMAQEKIGALIVIQGKEALVRYLQGGYYLNGEFSDALLYSIFDSSSLGHDGAVIVEGNKITRFGVHLPLSENMGQLRRRGTRHSAALGISEHSDALTIVVSEERGKISIARNGKLKAIEDVADLKNKINNFLQDTVEGKKSFFHHRSFISNYRDKALALIVAITLWFLFV